MGKYFSQKKYAKLARQAAAEGIVMLRNDKQVLPFQRGTKIAVFGRSQFNYYKSGTGSGGLVNVAYEVGILDALKGCPDVELNQKVLEVYEEWVKEHPFEEGVGWASEPWCQKEMLLDENIVQQAAQESEAAVIIIARTAGEDKDNSAQGGSYLLNEEEKLMLKTVCSYFDKTVVLLNVGNIIDMKWVEEVNPSAVLYVWQGGQEGGNAVLDVLTGTVSPCGKLTDTIAKDIEDYPSTAHYGDAVQNIYEEDIYVGYRYFETFAKDKVLYPFGFGLSYTEFAICTESVAYELAEDDSQCAAYEQSGDDFNKNGMVTVKVLVTNTGLRPGKEVVQVYCEAPQGTLGKPSRALCGFAKTKVLDAGESQLLTIECPAYYLASYDDSGCTGHRFCYVLEAGEYRFYVGNDVRSAVLAGGIQITETKVIEQLKQALAPVTAFRRLRPDGEGNAVLEDVPLREYSLQKRIQSNRPKDIPYTGVQGWKLVDVVNGRVRMEDFIAQLSDEQLCIMLRGEGMCSPKATPGTAAAFGGITKELLDYGIPVGCCADGPSGIRMDCGTIAFSLPSGTALACSFNEELSMQLFEMMGLELRRNKIESLLGPGMNLRRNPLNGRNFEYFSEDPFVTGKMAAAQLRGMHKYQVTGTVKHFACNNQEFKRSEAEAVLSERALREIYLKGFEIAVKEAGAYMIMSTYGPVNGLWTASSYDLLTEILRNEWGYKGIVMTDWWAKGNEEGQEASRQQVAPMVRSQNDLYMVVEDSATNSMGDNLAEGLANGTLTRGELVRSAMNVCQVLMNSPAFLRLQGIETEIDRELAEYVSEEELAMQSIPALVLDQETVIDPQTIQADKKCRRILRIQTKKPGRCRLILTVRANTGMPLAQIPLSISKNREFIKTIALTGTDTEWRTEIVDLGEVDGSDCYITLFFGQGGMEVGECRFSCMPSETE